MRLEKRKVVVIDICEKSPDKKHFEIINGYKIGECKYCHRKRDYNELQSKYLTDARY
jgi:hypothetical protein